MPRGSVITTLKYAAAAMPTHDDFANTSHRSARAAAGCAAMVITASLVAIFALARFPGNNKCLPPMKTGDATFSALADALLLDIQMLAPLQHTAEAHTAPPRRR